MWTVVRTPASGKWQGSRAGKRGTRVRLVPKFSGGAVASPVVQAENRTQQGWRHPGWAFIDGITDPSRTRPRV
jgi:hypothetical protein